MTGGDDGSGGRGPNGALATGSTLRDGRYRIDRLIGAGGFSYVYGARDLVLERNLAIKELFVSQLGWWRDGATVRHGGDRRSRRVWERFDHECRVQAGLRTSSVVTVHDMLHENGTLYLVMELVEGRTLDRIIASGNQEIENVLDWADQLCEGLSAIHAAGLIHLDIKPSNLALLDTRHLQILDLGSARSSRTGDRDTVTFFTPGWAAPEQSDPVRRVDVRTDLYAVGATLIALLTGSWPRADPDLPRDVTPDDARTLLALRCDARVADVIACCVDADPDGRPATAQLLRARLETVRRQVLIEELRGRVNAYLSKYQAIVGGESQTSIRLRDEARQAIRDFARGTGKELTARALVEGYVTYCEAEIRRHLDRSRPTCPPDSR